MSLQNIKIDNTGNILWNTRKDFDNTFSITDIFEYDNNYYNSAVENLKIGQSIRNLQAVYKLDNKGKEIFYKIDTFGNKSIFSPVNTKRNDNKLLSLRIRHSTGNLMNDMLTYDLEAKYLFHKQIDSIYEPHFFSFSSSQTTNTYNNEIIFSFGYWSRDTTGPIFYRIYNSDGELINQFKFNEAVRAISSASPMNSIKLRNGDYLLSYRTNLYNNIPMNLIKRISPTGLVRWEDTLKYDYVYYSKMIEDNDDNIIICE